MPSRKYHRRTFSSALPEGSRVLIYCRYSGEHQDDRSQRMELERAIDAGGWQLVEWFQDDARSGSSDQRPGWQALIARSHEQPRPADGVVAWKGDRISRDQLDASYYKADLRRRGYVLHFLADELPDGPMQPLFESLLQWKAEQDLRDISANTIRGQQSVVRLEIERDGKTVTGFSSGGFPPRGYRRSAPIRTGQRRNGDPRYNVLWEPDPALWPACRRAVELLLAGESYERINAATGLFKQAAHLSTWFRSEALYGRRRHGEAVVEDAHERLVTALEEPLVLERLEAGKRQQARTHPRRVASSWLLSGILHCGYCRDAGRAGAMQGHESRGARWYRCAHRHAGGECPAVLVPADEAERAVVVAVLEQLTVERYAPWFATVAAAIEERLAAGRGDAERLDAEIARLGRQARNLADLLADDPSPALRERLREAEEQLRRRRLERARCGQAAGLLPDDVGIFLADLRGQVGDSADVARRRAAIGSVVEGIAAHAGRLVLAWRHPVPGELRGYGIVPPAGCLPKPRVLPIYRRKGKHVAAYTEELARDREAGLSYAALGERYGVSAQRAARVYKAYRARGEAV